MELNRHLNHAESLFTDVELVQFEAILKKVKPFPEKKLSQEFL